VSIFVHERQNTLFVYVVSAEERASTAADVDAVHDARNGKLANYSGNAWTRKRKEKTTPFGVNSMRSQVLYPAAQECMDNETRQACKDCPTQRFLATAVYAQWYSSTHKEKRTNFGLSFQNAYNHATTSLCRHERTVLLSDRH